MKSVSQFLALVALVTPGFTQTVDLATAATFGILAPKEITNSGATEIFGSVGVESTEVTGFPPGTLTGTMQTDSAAVTQAITDANNARIAALALTPTETISTLGSGVTLTPGVYAFAGAGAAGGGGTTGGGGGGGGGGATGPPTRKVRVKRQGQGGGTTGGGGGASGGGGGGGVGVAAPIVFAGNLTLDGAGTYIFQGTSSMTVETGARMILTGGASSADIFFAIGATVIIDGGAVLKGTIMAASTVNIGAGAAINGGVYSDATISVVDSKVGLSAGAVAAS